MVKQKVISTLLNQGGRLKEDQSWYQLGLDHGVESPKPKKAKKDPIYAKKSIGTKTQDIWRTYLKQQSRLELFKQNVSNGEVTSEVYKKVENIPVDINYEDYDIERVTTNPNGSPWLKMKKRIKLFDEAHIKDLKEVLTAELEPIEIEYTVSNNNHLFIFSSDKHIGALTKENSVYTNKYDKEEITKRLFTLTFGLIHKLKSIYGKFESIYYMDLGDALDGFDNKTTRGLGGASLHTLPQQLNNREQHDLYIEVHKKLFDSIIANNVANKVYYITTSNSNHGGDFEYGAMRHLETYLNVKYPEIKTFVSYKPLNHFIVDNTAIIFGHGKDDEDMRNGFPLVLNDKVENYINDYIRVNKLTDYKITVVSGDLHQSATTYGKNFRYKKVLSQYGGSKWIHTNYGSDTPGISCDVLHQDLGFINNDYLFPTEDKSNTGIEF